MTRIDPHSLLQKAFINSSVSRLSPSDAVIVNPRNNCKEVIELMIGKKIGSVLVGEDRSIKGIFTERDVLRKLLPLPREVSSLRVEEIMTSGPQYVPHTGSVAKALYLMYAGGFRHVPVECKEGHWKMLSVADFIKFIYDRIKSRFEMQPEGESYVFGGNALDLFLEGNIAALKLSPVLMVESSTSCSEVIGRMIAGKVGSAVVGDIDKGVVQGIVTERDVLKRYVLNKSELSKSTVMDIATKSPVTLQQSTSVLYALERMTEGKFRHIPVVNTLEKIVGVLSVKDFLSYICQSIVGELSKAKED